VQQQNEAAIESEVEREVAKAFLRFLTRAKQALSKGKARDWKGFRKGVVKV
jgi:hypothetical protein